MILGRLVNSDRWSVHEDGVYWRFDLPDKEKKRTIRGGQAANEFMPINLLEVIAMIGMAYVTVDMRRNTPVRKGKVFLSRADDEAAVAGVKRWREEAEEASPSRSIAENDGGIRNDGRTVVSSKARRLG